MDIIFVFNDVMWTQWKNLDKKNKLNWNHMVIIIITRFVVAILRYGSNVCVCAVYVLIKTLA